jgi:hypothetical protein
MNEAPHGKEQLFHIWSTVSIKLKLSNFFVSNEVKITPKMGGYGATTNTRYSLTENQPDDHSDDTPQNGTFQNSRSRGCQGSGTLTHVSVFSTQFYYQRS